MQLWCWNYKKSTLNCLHLAYHNILMVSHDTNFRSTEIDVLYCQSVIISMVYRFMCILDSLCTINDILATISPQFFKNDIDYLLDCVSIIRFY